MAPNKEATILIKFKILQISYKIINKFNPSSINSISKM